MEILSQATVGQYVQYVARPTSSLDALLVVIDQHQITRESALRSLGAENTIG